LIRSSPCASRGLSLSKGIKWKRQNKQLHAWKSYLDMLEIPKYKRYFYHLEGMIAQHEKKNDVAIENHEKFLYLWKKADQGITELADAEKQLAMIKQDAK
jgi:hypothetical protein